MITQLELNPEEHEVLVPALEREVNDLTDEISHTDNGEFKDMLKHRRIVLGGILRKVREMVAETGAAG